MSTSAAALPEWRTIIESQLTANPQCNVYALATTEDSAPRVRHVVHRGFTPSSLLLASTDKRMPKAAQLSNSPLIETAWYFAPAFTQVRVRGRAYTFPAAPRQSALAGEGSGAGEGFATLPPKPDTTSDESALAQWLAAWNDMFNKTTSPYLRATFARPAVPGSKLVDAPDSATWPNKLPAGEQADPADAETLAFAESNFCVLAIEPLRVEFLNLKTSPHERTEWVLTDGEWVKEELVP